MPTRNWSEKWTGRARTRRRPNTAQATSWTRARRASGSGASRRTPPRASADAGPSAHTKPDNGGNTYGRVRVEGERRIAVEEPEKVEDEREQAREGCEGGYPSPRGVQDEDSRGAYEHEQHEVVRPHQPEHGAGGDGEEVPTRAARRVEEVKGEQQQRRSHDEVGVREEAEEREQAGEGVEIVPGAAAGDGEQQPSQSSSGGNEQERGKAMRPPDAKAGQPALRHEQEAQGGQHRDDSVGEKEASPAKEGARPAHEPPLRVDQRGSVVLEQDPVLEQERSLLSLSGVAQVVVEVVDVVEGADEGAARRRAHEGHHVGREREGQDQQEGEGKGPPVVRLTTGQGNLLSQQRIAGA